MILVDGGRVHKYIVAHIKDAWQPSKYPLDDFLKNFSGTGDAEVEAGIPPETDMRGEGGNIAGRRIKDKLLVS